MDQALRVLVSAGASGIGASIAERFLADGAKGSICDRDETAVGIATQIDSALHAVVGDVADAGDTVRWVEEVVDLWGGVDVLVNNAGIAGPTALVEDIDPGSWRECLAVNLDSHFLMARLIIPHMKKQQ